MPQIEFESKVISHLNLEVFCIRALEAVGVPTADAGLVAKVLVETSLRGVDSHGVARLPHYLRRIEHGGINPRPQLKVHQVAMALALVDGDHALGHIVMNEAANQAITIAEEVGAGWVSVNNSSHCGALAHYGLKIADAGMVGIVLSHVDPMVVPFGSAKPFCGTNPICITAPRKGRADERPSGAFCLDMATSKVPWNTIVNAHTEGVGIPFGWAVDEDGFDTAEPERVAALYPVGGYKGSGLGLAIDILCSLFGGAPYGPHIPKMYADYHNNRRLGGLVGAIAINAFLPIEQFCDRLTNMLREWNELPAVDPNLPVRFPGELELIERELRMAEGIPVGLKLMQEFDAVADRYRIERPE